jgi:tRNA pseudouridine55 synthase
VQRVRLALGIRAVGHTGTLDPFATGLLVVLVGRATRVARFVEAQPKTYLASARLGVATDTDDATGAVIGGDPAALPGIDELRGALASFAGAQQQRPPAFSAKRIDSERSHQLARRGMAVALRDSPIVVHDIELLEYLPPDLVFRCTVSAGTYVRALARDLGDQFGAGGHLTALRRERIGALDVADAVPADDLAAGQPLVPLARVLRHLPAVALDDFGRVAVRHGRSVSGEPALTGTVALLHEGEVVAVAEAGAGVLRPVVVLEGA